MPVVRSGWVSDHASRARIAATCRSRYAAAGPSTITLPIPA